MDATTACPTFLITLTEPNAGTDASGQQTTAVLEGDHYVLDADLPGFDREDIHLELQGDVLTITAQHNNEKEDKDEEGKYLCRERSTSSFTRSFDVSGIDTEKITAAYDKGVLTLTLPKQTEEVPASRRIEIQ